MGSIILKSINITLKQSDLADAIAQIEMLRDGLVESLDELAMKLAEEGKQIAKMHIASLGAIDTGALSDSIDCLYNNTRHKGKIFTGVPYAVYVEFGTGIVGALNDHPLAGELGIEYDRNGHGEAGWWYPSDKGWYQPKDGGPLMAWTKGMPARPFMYNTFRELEQKAESEGARFIAEYIP